MQTPAKKRTLQQRARVWALFAFFLLLWFPLWQLNQPEPTFAEQPLSYWMERMSNPATAAHTSSLLSELGPEALPTLIEAVQTPTPTVFEEQLHALAQQLRLAPPRHYDAANIRATAAYVLGQMGVAAAGAAPHLTTALDDGDSVVAYRASRALAQIGVPALPGLLDAMTNSPSRRVRQLSVQTLGRMGPVARRAAPALVAAQQFSPALTNEIREALTAIQR